jgi:glycosyltransferase involved in cell wall biosynthesis
MIDGKNGYLFRPGDAATLLQALHQLADNQDRFAEQAAAIAATVEPYRIDRYIDRLEEIMKGLVK